MQQGRQRSRDELTSLLAERLARKKALDSAIYVDPSVGPTFDSAKADGQDNSDKSKGLALSGPLHKSPAVAAFFDEARDEMVAAVHDMWQRYSPADRKSEDDSAREGAEEEEGPDDHHPHPDGAKNWISVAAARNPDLASALLGYVPAAAPLAAHRRSTSSASYTSSSTSSTLSSYEPPELMEELEWWLPGLVEDGKFKFVDGPDDEQEEAKEDDIDNDGNDEDNNDEAGSTHTGDKARTDSVSEESLTDVFRSIECETTTTDQDDTNQYRTFTITESAINPNNTFDSAVGCAPTEEMDNTFIAAAAAAAAASTVGRSSALTFYERVVQAPATSDGSSRSSSDGAPGAAEQTTEITESYAPDDGGFAIECKFEQQLGILPQETNETAVGAAPNAADDADNWEAEVVEARRVKQELQDRLRKMLEDEAALMEEWKEMEEKKRIDDEQEESKVAPNEEDEIEQEENTDQKKEGEKKFSYVKHSLRGPTSLRRFNPNRSKDVSSSMSKLKTKLSTYCRGAKRETISALSALSDEGQFSFP